MPAPGFKSLPIRESTHHKIKLLAVAEGVTMQDWIDRAAAAKPDDDKKALDIFRAARLKNPEATRLLLEALKAL